VIVRGRVQGVGFRFWTHERARAVGAAGWVRNRADGAVEAVFEGAPDVVEAMLAFCRAGPRHARVEGVEDAAEEPEGLAGFEVR
jgi:acylphosphatase